MLEERRNWKVSRRDGHADGQIANRRRNGRKGEFGQTTYPRVARWRWPATPGRYAQWLHTRGQLPQPPPPPKVIEYRLVARCCPGRRAVVAAFWPCPRMRRSRGQRQSGRRRCAALSRRAVSRWAGDGVRRFAVGGVAVQVRGGSVIFDPLTGRSAWLCRLRQCPGRTP
jgi:hypothetical protein